LLHSKQTGVGAKDLSGPVGIFAMLGAQVHADYRLALSFLVLLNINLAVLNLLPLPVLDGGHIVMAILEKLRGRPLNVKVVEYATTVFAVLLISFMLYVTFFDLKRLSLFKSMFKRELTIEQPETNPPAPAAVPAQP
jgi:regulator of sigma E protease